MINNENAPSTFSVLTIWGNTVWCRLSFQDYFDIVKSPMDLSTIKRKLDTGQYQEPWQYVDDIWLMFNNAWLYNRKTSRVYKYCSKLSEVFEQEIDPVMQSLGYCCGRKVRNFWTDKNCVENLTNQNPEASDYKLLWSRDLIITCGFIHSTWHILVLCVYQFILSPTCPVEFFGKWWKAMTVKPTES